MSPRKPDPVLDKPDVDDDVLVDVQDLEVHFALRGGALARIFGRDIGAVKAVDGVSLRLRRGEVVGVVGESGSGKTTLGRALLGLAPITAGHIRLSDVDLATVSERRLRGLRRKLQMVFQDPNAALNPSMTVEESVGDPLRIHKLASGTADRRAKVSAALERVGLSPVERFLPKYPSDLSGGQKQRAVIARAIIMGPELLVADEPISMLDMSVRAKILELMIELKDTLGLTYIYITHDLASAKFFCDRIAIMYLGRIVEIGDTDEIFADPKHPYTKALLRAIPEPDPRRMVPRDLPRGEIPDAARPPMGCAFHPRCPEAVAECGWESRDLGALLEDHWTRRDAATYERERALVGDLEALDEPSKTATLGTGASAAEVRRLLDSIREERPDDPFWRGVRDLGEGPGGVSVTFHPGVDPALRQADGVEVACILHPTPVTLEPVARPDG
jgi:peptide/nickel transport system ATP-binding protein